MADPVKQGIVQGSIAPIRADKLRLGVVQKLVVPVSAPDGVFTPRFVDGQPGVVTPETIAHAKQCALRLIGRMADLPHSQEAGDALAMAFTILHYSGKSEP